MNTPDRFTQLGQELARAQDRERDGEGGVRRAAVRAALLDVTHESRPRLRWAGAAVVTAALAALLVLWLMPASPLSFSVGEHGDPGVVGAWLAAPPERTESLVFSDGSEIELQPGSRARVAQLGPAGSSVVLERGAAEVWIEPGGGRRWEIDAGPYRVRVTGTRFFVAWDPSRDAFDLDLREGSVVVEGPRIDGARSVEAGQVLRVVAPEMHTASATDAGPAAADGAPAARAAPAVPAAPLGAAEPEPADAQPARDHERSRSRDRTAPRRERSGDKPPEASASPTAETTDATEPAPTAEPLWKRAAAERRYRDALAAAEAHGFDDLCESLPARDLLRLADVARFARRPGRASTALQAVRRRFADTAPAAMAAFERGRIAFARGGAYAEAARWFGTYLRELPEGPLAREALGRLMEAQENAAAASDARATAQRYLRRYPTGPHAALAKQLARDGG